MTDNSNNSIYTNILILSLVIMTTISLHYAGSQIYLMGIHDLSMDSMFNWVLGYIFLGLLGIVTDHILKKIKRPITISDRATRINILVSITISLVLVGSVFVPFGASVDYYYDEENDFSILTPASRFSINSTIDGNNYANLLGNQLYMSIPQHQYASKLFIEFDYETDTSSIGTLGLRIGNDETYNTKYFHSSYYHDRYKEKIVYLSQDEIIDYIKDVDPNSKIHMHPNLLHNFDSRRLANELLDKPDNNFSWKLSTKSNFYAYLNVWEETTFSVAKQDINLRNGKDFLKIEIWDNTHNLVDIIRLDDDGTERANNKAGPIMEFPEAFILQPGLYRVLFLMGNDDTMLKWIKADAPVNFVTDSIMRFPILDPLVEFNILPLTNYSNIRPFDTPGIQNITYYQAGTEKTISLSTINKYVRIPVVPRTKYHFTTIKGFIDLIPNGLLASHSQDLFYPNNLFFEQKIDSADIIILPKSYESILNSESSLKRYTSGIEFKITKMVSLIRDNKYFVVLSIPDFVSENENFRLFSIHVQVKLSSIFDR